MTLTNARAGEKAAIALRRLRLSHIGTNAGTQSRVQIDEPIVANYAERMIAGDLVQTEQTPAEWSLERL